MIQPRSRIRCRLPTCWPTPKSPAPAGLPTHSRIAHVIKVQRMDDVDAADVRAADEADRSRIWTDLVTEFGRDEASRRWLAIFAATDAPRTG